MASSWTETSARWEHTVTPAMVIHLHQQFKALKHWGVRRVAAEFGISHAMLIYIEQGKRPLTEEFADKFRLVEKEWRAELDQALLEQPVERGVTILADFELPARIQLFANGRWKKL